MDALYIVRTRTPVADIYEFLTDNKNRIENINIHFSSFEDKAKLKKILVKFPEWSLLQCLTILK